MDKAPPRPTNRPSKLSRESGDKAEDFDFNDASSEAGTQMNQMNDAPPRPTHRPIRIQPTDPETRELSQQSNLKQQLEALDTPGGARNPEAVQAFEEVAARLNEEGPGGPTAARLGYPALGPKNAGVSAAPSRPLTRPVRHYKPSDAGTNDGENKPDNPSKKSQGSATASETTETDHKEDATQYGFSTDSSKPGSDTKLSSSSSTKPDTSFSAESAEINEMPASESLQQEAQTVPEPASIKPSPPSRPLRRPTRKHSESEAAEDSVSNTTIKESSDNNRDDVPPPQAPARPTNRPAHRPSSESHSEPGKREENSDHEEARRVNQEQPASNPTVAVRDESYEDSQQTFGQPLQASQKPEKDTSHTEHAVVEHLESVQQPEDSAVNEVNMTEETLVQHVEEVQEGFNPDEVEIVEIKNSETPIDSESHAHPDPEAESTDRRVSDASEPMSPKTPDRTADRQVGGVSNNADEPVKIEAQEGAAASADAANIETGSNEKELSNPSPDFQPLRADSLDTSDVSDLDLARMRTSSIARLRPENTSARITTSNDREPSESGTVKNAEHIGEAGSEEPASISKPKEDKITEKQSSERGEVAEGAAKDRLEGQPGDQKAEVNKRQTQDSTGKDLDSPSPKEADNVEKSLAAQSDANNDRSLAPARSGNRPDRPLKPKPKGALLSRFENALKEHELSSKPEIKPKPKPRGRGASGRVAAMQASMFADLNEALSRGPPGRPRLRSQDANTEAEPSETPPRETKVDANESADAQIKAMPQTGRSRAARGGSGPRRRLPESAKPKLNITVLDEPLWEVAPRGFQSFKAKEGADSGVDSVVTTSDAEGTSELKRTASSSKAAPSMDEDEPLTNSTSFKLPREFPEYPPDDAGVSKDRRLQNTSISSSEAKVASSQDTPRSSSSESIASSASNMGAGSELDLRMALQRSLGSTADIRADTPSAMVGRTVEPALAGLDLPSLKSLVDRAPSPRESKILVEEPPQQQQQLEEDLSRRSSVEDFLPRSRRQTQTEELGVSLAQYLDKSPQSTDPSPLAAKAKAESQGSGHSSETKEENTEAENAE